MEQLEEMLAQQLLAELSRRNIDLITQWALDNRELVPVLLAFALGTDQYLSQRAAWVMEKLSERQKGIYQTQITLIITSFKTIPWSSTRRTLSKVLMLHSVPEEHEGLLFDLCIMYLESPTEPVAVKANCMTILFNMLPRYPDLQNEVFAVIEQQAPHHSVGFVSRYNVLRAKLNAKKSLKKTKPN